MEVLTIVCLVVMIIFGIAFGISLIIMACHGILCCDACITNDEIDRLRDEKRALLKENDELKNRKISISYN